MNYHLIDNETLSRLVKEQELKFRQWARDNYIAFTPIKESGIQSFKTNAD